ncbi:MAG TPA: hypothetical protein VKQ11_19425 [Candidatus Sulfotelmatobacter sp.]|nr:hypothetical protein [Candidatus Sulfotelmatobacter sp.]
MFFRIIGNISDIETVASGKGVRERRRLQKFYGGALEETHGHCIGQADKWYDMSRRVALV